MKRSHLAGAVGAGAIGAVLRAGVVTSRLGPVDADEAVVGLMARDLLRGRVEAFFWGQDYGGIHEQVLVALLLAVRVPGWLAMELAPIAWAAAAAVLTWRIGRRLALGEGAAVMAGAFVWLTSGAFVWLSTKERGFYGATMVMGLVALLFALRLIQGTSALPPRRADALVLGLAAGTGWYASPQIAYLALPAALVLVAGGRARWRALVAHVPVVVVGVLVGALPWIVVNVRTGFASLDLAATLPATTYGDRLTIFFRHALPIASGLKVPFTLAWFGGDVGRAAYGLSLLVVVVLAVLAVVRRWPLWPVGVGVLAYPLLYAAFPTSYYFGDPRYLYFLWPMVALLVVDAARRLHVAVAVGVVVVATVVGVAGLQRMASLPWTPDQATHDIAPVSIDAAVGALERSGDRYAYADYWLSYRITFATDRRVIASPVQLVRSARDDRAVAAASARSPVPYVLVAGSCYDRAMRTMLGESGVAHDAERAGRLVIVRPARAVGSDAVAAAWAAAC